MLYGRRKGFRDFEAYQFLDFFQELPPNYYKIIIKIILILILVQEYGLFIMFGRVEF